MQMVQLSHVCGLHHRHTERVNCACSLTFRTNHARVMTSDLTKAGALLLHGVKENTFVSYSITNSSTLHMLFLIYDF